jgi:hypothetical protein
VWYLLCGTCCVVLAVWYLLYGTCCMVLAVWYLLYGTCCMSPFWNLNFVVVPDYGGSVGPS